MTTAGPKVCKHVFSVCGQMTEAGGRRMHMVMVSVLDDPGLRRAHGVACRAGIQHCVTCSVRTSGSPSILCRRMLMSVVRETGYVVPNGGDTGAREHVGGERGRLPLTRQCQALPVRQLSELQHDLTQQHPHAIHTTAPTAPTPAAPKISQPPTRRHHIHTHT